MTQFNYTALILLLISLPLKTFASSWSEVDSSKATLKFGFISPLLTMTTTDLNNVGPKLEYKPNISTKTFASVAYKGIGLSAATSNPVSSDSSAKYGNTDSTDFQFRFNYVQWSFSAFYQNYKGYYLSNSDSVGSLTSNGSYTQYPDMKSYHLGFGAIYILNPDSYSLTATIDNTARQTSSGWSFLLGTSIGQNQISNSGSLIPTNLLGTYGDFEKFRSCNLYSLHVGGGIAGTLVLFDPIYATAGALFLTGQEVQNIQNSDSQTNKTLPSFKFIGKFGLGYNGAFWITGFAMQFDVVNHNISNTLISTSTVESSLYIGAHL